jgi:DNA-directed RNA polymerase specialized sigma24 family protein
MPVTETDKVVLFEQFIDLYYPAILSAITRLTGLQDEKELETLTVKVFVDLWDNSEQLFNLPRPPAFIYKIVLQHVFTYLKKQGSEEHILLLKNALPIDPVYYLHIFEPEKKSFTLTLLRKIKSIWSQFR